jgi:excisionase family DNA binding protein
MTGMLKTRAQDTTASDELKAAVAKGTMDLNQAQEFTGLKRSFFYTLMNRGDVRCVKVGKRRLLLRADVEKLLADSLCAAK